MISNLAMATSVLPESDASTAQITDVAGRGRQHQREEAAGVEERDLIVRATSGGARPGVQKVNIGTGAQRRDDRPAIIRSREAAKIAESDGLAGTASGSGRAAHHCRIQPIRGV